MGISIVPTEVLELLNFARRCYVAADVDLDGKVDSSEFSGMIEVMKSIMTLIAELSFSFGVIEAKETYISQVPQLTYS